jgi:hypothetical protein
MSRFARTRIIALAILALIAVCGANAQQQVSLKIGDKDYTITEFAGRTSHMVALSGPDGTAMVSVVKDKITAYINPPGGGQFKALIDKVWAAYQAQKNGASGGQQATDTAPPADDPNEALRAQVAAATARARARAGAGATSAQTSGVASERPVEFTATGPTVTDPKFGEVTWNKDLTLATFVQSGNGMALPTKVTATYEGGDAPPTEGQKAGKAVKGGLTAVLQSSNTRASAANTVGATNEVWRLDSQNGANGHTRLYESGGHRTGGEIDRSGRDPAKAIYEPWLDELRKDRDAVIKAAEAATKDGQLSPIDITSYRSQAAGQSLIEATKDMHP